MYTELPTTKRCCFCIPLRRGIIFWGYFKLAFTCIALFPFLLLVAISAIFGGHWEYLLIAFIMTIDISLNIVLIIAGHTKNFELLRMYCYYLLGHMVVIFGIAVWLASILFKCGRHWEELSAMIVVVAYIFLMAYIFFLVRSEFKKIQDLGAFQFNNNAVSYTLAVPEVDAKQEAERVEEKKFNVH